MDVNVYKDNWMDLLYKQICNVLEINQEVEVDSKKDVEIKAAPIVKEEKPTTRVTPKIAKPPVTNHVVTSPVITSPVTSSSKIKENNKSNPENNLKIVEKEVVEYVGEGGEDVIIPDGVTVIGEQAFGDGTKPVKSISIPSSVTLIRKNAFKNKNNINGLTVIVRVDSIKKYLQMDGKQNFIDCAKVRLKNKEDKQITEIVVPDGLKRIPDYAFCKCSSLSTITIPEGISVIGSNAFFGCSSLKALSFPKSIIEIRDYACDGCERLKSVGLPPKIRRLSSYLFYGCTSLVSIALPESIESIGRWAFTFCTSLEVITIPKNVEIVDGCAFAYCENLQIINYSGTKKEWKNVKRSTDIVNYSTPCKNVHCSDGKAKINSGIFGPTYIE